ncbi:ATP-binding protein [Streptomyces sp. CA-251387]|uniref:ATP-binding protein n=1 Tax=Streptomyces sp. CA-251387 TaxID=3240064 RepID=UPI003D8E70BB
MSGAVPGGLWEREVECAAVAGAVKAAVQGQAGVLLVQGPAGIGKTRLMAEARTRAEEAGALTAAARGTELEREFAFGVVRQWFEPLLAVAEAERQQAWWAGPAAQAREVLAAVGAPSVPLGDFAVLHGLFWLVANVSQDRPLVLLVDDLQWCDVPSLRFLAYLLPRLEGLPVLVSAALRSGEAATDERLLAQVTADPSVQVVRPGPLSAAAAARLLEQALPGPVEDAFTAACHRASGGNPLLLAELARTLTAQGMAANSANADKVAELGPQAVARLVAARMARLPAATAALPQAVAVLGGETDLATATSLAGTLALSMGTASPAQATPTAGLEAAAALEQLEILHLGQEGARIRLSFVHPLVRSAVYHALNPAERAAAHQHAARLLTRAGADPERIAAHLLQTFATGNPDTVDTLREAATVATSRGAPGSAYVYLRRALIEPPPPNQHLQVLIAAGQAALLVDVEAAASLLQQAYDHTTDPVKRADLAALLGTAYVSLCAPDRGIALQAETLTKLPDADQDRRRRLQAGILTAETVYLPDRDDAQMNWDGIRHLPDYDCLGSHLLNCAIACRETALCDPAAAQRARRAFADGTLISKAAGDIAFDGGIIVLLAAEDDTVMRKLDTLIEQAHHHGSLLALAPTYAQRSYGWLGRGQLSEAECDARESLRLAALSAVSVGSYFADSFLAETLTEQGRLDEAEQALAEIGVTTATNPEGPTYVAWTILVRLQRLHGDHEAALDAAQRAREACDAYGIRNPALCGWRSEAALALHALDRREEARDMATEELALARQWGAPRTLGRALRVSGLVIGGSKGLDLLREAVTALEGSTARLEHAMALTDLGASLRRAGHRIEARPPLRQALDLATRCGATPLADRARTELAAAGGRPRRTALTGPAALTPSERRIAALAAEGATNRQIAQQLYVTPKTVEVHLSAAYRKLGITTRTQLPAACSLTE